MQKIAKAFTLVELIVVVTILAILSTIAFISLQNYAKDARDGNRIASLKNIESGLRIFQAITGNYPEPDANIQVLSSGSILSYQWFIWANVSRMIKINTTPLDPLDQEKYIYTSNALKTKYQLLTFLERTDQISYINQWYALDYSNRNWKNIGSTLWIFMDTNNIPITTSIDILSTNSGTTYKTIFSNTDTVSFSWYPLASIINTRQWDAPTNCPEWFISVPWNAEFNTNGWFCVAKYEMAYDDAVSPDSCNATCTPLPPNNTAGQTDWNTMNYQVWKNIVSKTWLYTVTNLKQIEAIQACKSMGAWYHLITNNEWMTVSRNIESIKENWSTKEIGSGNLSNGISWYLPFWCTATGWNIESRTYGTKTWPWWDDTCNTKRKQILSNGQDIWDLAGNVWEYVNKSSILEGDSYFSWRLSVVWTSSWAWWDDDWIYVQDDMRKYGSSFWYGISKWMGNVYYSNWVLNNVFMRWWGSNGTQNVWMYALYLFWYGTNYGRHIWFRCAYIP